MESNTAISERPVAAASLNAQVERAPTPTSFLSRLNQSRIPSLDGLRGIAAILVVLVHTNAINPSSDRLRLSGPFAVNIFFVLSGFLITLLLIREYEKTGAVSLRNFYIRRTLRVFPAFYAAWTIALLAAILTRTNFSFWEPVATFFYMGDYYSALVSPGKFRVMPIAWSLGVEEKFYLLWPAVFVFCLGRWKRLFQVCIWVIGLVWANKLILAHWVKPHDNYVQYAFDTQVDVIMLGCAVALATRLPSMHELFRKVTARPSWILVTLALLIGPLFAYNSLAGNKADLARYYFAYIIPSQILLIALLLVQLITWGQHPWVRWLNSRPMVFLGTLSYGIYLYHMPILWLLDQFAKSHIPWKAFRVLELLAPMVVAYISYRWIEKPLLARKHKYSTV